MNGRQLKNSILQLAIQGRLVPQDSNDEPASALLSRIREEKKRLVEEKKIKKDKPLAPIKDEEKPFEIPESWEWVRLGEIGDWGAGATPAKGNMDYYNKGNIPWLRTGDLNNGIVKDVEMRITEKALSECSLRKCNVGDVLIAMYGATIGKVAIAGIELTTNQACCACTPLCLYNKYLFYFLQANKDVFIKMGSGGAQPNISREKIIYTLFPLPPLAEQHRIVEKIEELLPLVEEYDEAQTKLDKLNSELPEKLKNSILQQAIMGRLDTRNDKDEPASALLSRIREEKKKLVEEKKIKKDKPLAPIKDEEKPFEIPESWEWVRLGDIANYGDVKKKNKVTDFSRNIWSLDLEDIEKGGKLIKKIYLNERKSKGERTFFQKGDILYSKLRPYLQKILIADEDGACSTELVPFTCYSNISHIYICYCLKSNFIDNYIASKSFGIKMPRVSTETMTNLIIPLPPIAEQHRIVDKLEKIFEKIESMKK